jgi:hypothetical protein
MVALPDCRCLYRHQREPASEGALQVGNMTNTEFFVLLGTVLAGVIWQRVDTHQLSGRIDELSGRIDHISDDLKHFYRDLGHLEKAIDILEHK